MLNVPTKSINFGGEPVSVKPERFYRRSSELYWNLKEALREGLLALPRDEKLFAQLTQIEWDLHADQSIRVFKQGRDESRRSPDRTDALALAWEARHLATKGLGILP